MVKSVEKGSDPLVYVVSDRRRLAPDARTTAAEIAALEAWLDAAVAARPDLVQIRERDLPPRELTAMVRRAVAASAGATRVLVNDRADVALVAGAHGVHLRADGPPVARIRAFGPAGWIVGRSTHAADAVARDPDYVVFGPVFSTASKPGAPAAGLDALRAIVAVTPAPVIAIGGIDMPGAAACIEAGAAGVAAIGLFAERGPASNRPWSHLPDVIGALRASMTARRC
jgi:thiamine-phosphate diphosphorylase